VKIKLVSDGTAHGSKFVDENGTTIPLIKAIEWRLEAGERSSKLKLTRIFILDQDEEVSYQDILVDGATAEIAFEVSDEMLKELMSMRTKVKS
jgi:hypothetical protein